MAILYAIKLIGMILAGVAVGRSLAYLFPEKEKAHLFVVWTFMACALAGAVLYFVFPKASLLYPFLEQFGIVFEGDPHVHRFLSPLLDPNFYGAIACIPLILLFAMRKEGISFYLLLGSLILTWSRSGIATCILTLGVAGLHRLFQVKSAPLRSIGFPAALIGGAALILGFAGNRVAQFGSRLLAVFEDPSSLERLVNTEVALPFFWEFPLFGMGYNFLSPVYSAESTLSTPDSSLFFSTLTFGLIPTLVLLGLFTFWVLQLGKKCRGNPTFSLLVTYASICLLFTSQFNNLIFYQYWLIPMIALFTHMEKTAQ